MLHILVVSIYNIVGMSLQQQEISIYYNLGVSIVFNIIV